MPAFFAALYSSTAPFITPWSVSPSAGWPKAAARSTRPSILQAPSSSEYSEWTCRWAQGEVLTGLLMVGAGPDGAGPVRGVLAAPCEDSDQALRAMQTGDEGAGLGDVSGDAHGPGRRQADEQRDEVLLGRVEGRLGLLDPVAKDDRATARRNRRDRAVGVVEGDDGPAPLGRRERRRGSGPPGAPPPRAARARPAARSLRRPRRPGRASAARAARA